MMIKGNKTVIAGKFLLKGDPAFLTSKVHMIGLFVAENVTDSGRTAGRDKKLLGGSKQEGRCGLVLLINDKI